MKINPRYFTTETGKNIFDFIEEKRTKIFSERSEAKKEADRIRSYYYPVYQEGKYIGRYAVPQ